MAQNQKLFTLIFGMWNSWEHIVLKTHGLDKFNSRPM